MSDKKPFEYRWSRKEANFGPPVAGEVKGGTHISIENFLMFEGKFVALRRPEANPQHEMPPKAQKAGKALLYFVHNLPIWGETTDEYVNRIVMENAGVKVKSYKVVDLNMELYEDTQQWAWTPYTLVELTTLPTPGVYGNEITEVVTFDIDTIPDEFGWWEKAELEECLRSALKV